MVKGVGIDILEIDRIRIALERNPKFMKRIFSESEIKYINSRKGNINTIAGLFAAKEAISKSLGSGIRNFKWTDIEIMHDSLGKPYTVLKGGAKDVATSKGIGVIHVSITHNEESALAYSIAEERNCDVESYDENNSTAESITKVNKNDMINKDIVDVRIKNNLKSYTIIDKEMVRKILPNRNPISHKGTYGRVGVVAGSLGMTGAAYLASQASLRSGSGLVYSIIPSSLAHIMEIKTTEVIVKPVEDEGRGQFIIKSLDDLIEELKHLDVVALGPGLGVDDQRIRIVEEIIKLCETPIVLDGDGINCVSHKKSMLIGNQKDIIITPHPGELARLLDTSIEDIQANRIESAKIASKKYGVITVLKGANTIISDKRGNIYINTTGNSGMATAGSGDVLTGIISSFIGQGIKILEAVVAGVYIHGLAGDLASQDKGKYGMIASDIVENVPYTIKTLGVI